MLFRKRRVAHTVPDQNELEAIRNEVAQLSRDFLQLRSDTTRALEEEGRKRAGDVLELTSAVAKLEQERGLRETELMDLRTRYEVIIKRVKQREGAGGDRGSESDLEAIRGIREARRRV